MYAYICNQMHVGMLCVLFVCFKLCSNCLVIDEDLEFQKVTREYFIFSFGDLKS